jgi:hypothetical protein
MGPTGETGPIGETGPTGATGPIAFEPTFIHVARLTEQILLAEENVIFDSIAVNYGDCGLIPSTSEVVLWAAGYYNVYFNIYHQEPCQFSVFLNDVIALDSIVGSPTGAAQNSSSLILQVVPSDLLYFPTSLSPSGFAAKIEFRNHTSFAPSITLNGQSGSGSASPQIVAVVVIFRLA